MDNLKELFLKATTYIKALWQKATNSLKDSWEKNKVGLCKVIVIALGVLLTAHFFFECSDCVSSFGPKKYVLEHNENGKVYELVFTVDLKSETYTYEGIDIDRAAKLGVIYAGVGTVKKKGNLYNKNEIRDGYEKYSLMNMSYYMFIAEDRSNLVYAGYKFVLE